MQKQDNKLMLQYYKTYDEIVYGSKNCLETKNNNLQHLKKILNVALEAPTNNPH